jgi:predicted nucleic acid-binding protein
VSVYLDTSVLVAALIEDEPAHEDCLKLLRRKGAAAWSHALAETFSTLTGGRLGIRVAPSLAAELITQSLLPRLAWVELSANEIAAALLEADAAGARGGACCDFLHLVAARKCGATSVLTLNLRHFTALTRPGDPAIAEP